MYAVTTLLAAGLIALCSLAGPAYPSRLLAHRHLRTICDRLDGLVTILLEDTSYQEDQNDLKGLPEGRISSWPHLKTAIEWVREPLKAVVS